MIVTERHADEPKPGHCRFQFSLAELIALTTVISLGLSILKWFPESWPLIVFVGVSLVAIHLDRHRSLQPMATLLFVIVTVVITGVLLPIIMLYMR